MQTLGYCIVLFNALRVFVCSTIPIGQKQEIFFVVVAFFLFFWQVDHWHVSLFSQFEYTTRKSEVIEKCSYLNALEKEILSATQELRKLFFESTTRSGDELMHKLFFEKKRRKTKKIQKKMGEVHIHLFIEIFSFVHCLQAGHASLSFICTCLCRSLTVNVNYCGEFCLAFRVKQLSWHCPTAKLRAGV